MGEGKRRAQAAFEQQKPEHRLGDAPIEAEYHEHMVAVARALNQMFNGDAPVGERKTGFVLLVYPFNDTSGRCNYISNGADRRDVVTLMKEMIQKFEGQPDLKGRA